MSIVSFPRTLVRPDALVPHTTTHGEELRIAGSAALVASPAARVDARAGARAGARAETRNEAIDVVRLAAAIGIVFVHSCQSPALNSWRNMFRFAVPFYLFASLYFQSLSMRRNAGRPFLSYVGGRVRRLYLPFVAWSLIYLVAHDIKRLIFGHSMMQLKFDVFLTGTEYHLWFLPFLLCTSMVMAVIHYTLVSRDARIRWLLIPLAILVGIWFTRMPLPAVGIDDFGETTTVLSHWWRASSAACWAMAFAWLTTIGPVVYSVGTLIGVGGIALMLTCSLKQVVEGIQIVPRSLTGLGCLLAAMAPWRGEVMSQLARFGRYGYGIYLCHVLIVEPTHILTANVHGKANVWTDLATFFLAFTGSMVLVHLIACSRKLKWLNG